MSCRVEVGLLILWVPDAAMCDLMLGAASAVFSGQRVARFTRSSVVRRTVCVSPNFRKDFGREKQFWSPTEIKFLLSIIF